MRDVRASKGPRETAAIFRTGQLAHPPAERAFASN
jgi:hypothetical protein